MLLLRHLVHCSPNKLYELQLHPQAFPQCESLYYLGSYGAAKPMRSLTFAYACHTVIMQSLLEIGSVSL